MKELSAMKPIIKRVEKGDKVPFPCPEGDGYRLDIAGESGFQIKYNDKHAFLVSDHKLEKVKLDGIPNWSRHEIIHDVMSG